MKILTVLEVYDYLLSTGNYILAHHPSRKRYKPWRVYVAVKAGYIHAANFKTQDEGMKYFNILTK